MAMREIWTKDVAEFHGEPVDFGPLWCWPKPVQAGGPPILLGAGSRWTPKRVAEYGNGWIPVDGFYKLARGVEALRVEAEQAGRSLKEFDLSVVTGYALAGFGGDNDHIRELLQLGFNRILLFVEPTAPQTRWPVLERYAQQIRACVP